MIRQTILPFKIDLPRDIITPHAGLALVGEFAVGLGFLKSADRYLPTPGSGAGYHPSEYVAPHGIDTRFKPCDGDSTKQPTRSHSMGVRPF
jgi:hypothetical protein